MNISAYGVGKATLMTSPDSDTAPIITLAQLVAEKSRKMEQQKGGINSGTQHSTEAAQALDTQRLLANYTTTVSIVSGVSRKCTAAVETLLRQ